METRQTATRKSEWMQKSKWIQRQFTRAESGSVPLRNGQVIPLRYAFRCLYCGEFFNQKEAERHFGKTRIQYNSERARDTSQTAINIITYSAAVHGGDKVPDAVLDR